MIRLCLPFLLTLLLASFTLSAQQLNYNQTESFLKANSYWAWYDNNGLDFSSGVPVHDSTALTNLPSGPFGQHFAEGVASVSDPLTGELLFYSDGRRVWNRNHEIMLNGDNLYGNWKVTTVQGTCIIPVIGNKDQYYIFSLGGQDSYNRDPTRSGLYYNIVDMTLDNGNGEVLANFKNVPLDTSRRFLEVMVAIPGNNCNVWLVTHESDPSWLIDSTLENKNYLVYEVTASGINTTPIISQGRTGRLSANHMSVSSDRTKLYISEATSALSFTPFFNGAIYSELVQFDPNTGMVSNGLGIFPPPPFASLPGAFSPNGEKLFLLQTNIFSFPYPTSPLATLVQLDISSYDSLSISNSAIVIDTLPVDASIDFPANLKAYKDSIYVFYANSNAIGRINQPDLSGPLCDFQPLSIQLPLPYKTDQNYASPPLEVVFAFSTSGTVLLDTPVCGGVLLNPDISNLDSGFVWSTGHSDTFLYVDTPGIYWINYHSPRFSEGCVYVHTDTFIVRPGELAIRPEITINVDTLSTAVPYATYQWMLAGDIINGATSSKYVVTENGEYQVIVTDEWGCRDTSNIYEVLNVSIKSLGESAGVYIYPNPTLETVTIHAKEAIQYSLYQLDGRMLIQNKQSNRVDLSGFSDGMYLLKVSDQSGRMVHYERISKVPR